MPIQYGSSSMLIYEKDSDGLITKATIDFGTPVTTASIFAPGALVTCKNDSKIYRNSGTTASPVWEDISTISSSEMDANLLKVAVVNLTAANIKAMYAAPVLVLAPIAGKTIVVDSIDFEMTRTDTAFADGGVVVVQYKNTANGAGTALNADIAATVVTGAAGTVFTHRIPKDLSDTAIANVQGIGLYISNKTGAFTTGTGTAKLTIRYYAI